MRKIAFITGVGSGIGKETCLKFLSQGWEVIGLLRNDRHHNKLITASDNLSGKLRVIYANLESNNFESEVQSQIQELQLPHVNVLINVAGMLGLKDFSDIDSSFIETVFKVNFTAPVLLSKILTPYLSESAGRNIINISSMSGFQGSVRFPGLSVYGASKAALSSFSESLSVELQPNQINVNALAIGAVNTQMLQDAFPDFQAQVSATEMGGYIFDFATSGYKLLNGKTLPVAITNP